MSYGTNKAIAGMGTAEERTHANCLEAIQRYESVRSETDLQALYAWAKDQSWFLRSAADEAAMRRADLAARARIEKTRFPKLSRAGAQAADEVVTLMRTKHDVIVEHIWRIVQGLYDPIIAHPLAIARWLEPGSKANTAAFFMQAVAEVVLGAKGEVTRAAFLALSAEEKRALTEVIERTVTEGRSAFYEAFPQHRPSGWVSESASLPRERSADGLEDVALDGLDGSSEATPLPTRRGRVR